MNLKELVEVDQEKMSGTPVFHGTRVPIKNYLIVWKRARI